MAKEWCRDARKMADTEALSRAEMEKTLGALKQEQHELVEKFKEAKIGRRSTEAGLKNAEKQVEDQRQLLHVTETNLAIEKQVVLNLKTALQKAKEEVQLAKEAAEAEKRTVCQKYAGITAALHGVRLSMLQVSLQILLGGCPKMSSTL